MASGITLERLAARVGGRVVGDPTTLVTHVTHDSRAVRDGSLFMAVRGRRVNGHDFIDGAVAAGAAAVGVEEEPTLPIPALVVPDTRRALGPVAAALHGHPSEHLTVIGVTGTNGKTTVAHLLESIIRAAGLRPAVVGTVGARIGDAKVPIELTTPEAPDFQRLLADMVESGVDIAAVEVSSHALALGRVDATRFSVAAFTNLSQDHLDFHGDMESYYQAKASLFVPDRVDRAVVWMDDPAGRRLAAETPLPVVTVGTGPDNDVTVRSLETTLRGSTFVVSGLGGEATVRLPLAGDFNVANALIAGACAVAAGVDWDSIAAGIAAVRRVPGRFEFVDTGGDVAIVVDYAHTPDGIASVIRASRALIGEGRILVVVGAGGDRDRAKRPLMGRAASEADVAFITSDNPRSEDPAAIVGDVLTGAGHGRARVIADPDRRSAIRAAIGEAAPGDLVLILGKGHEQGQEFDGVTLPFDDRVVARQEAAR